jgi:hypothetical protein
MNEVLKVEAEEYNNVESQWKGMTEVERNAFGCALIKVLSHLNSNLKDAKDDPMYRKRERRRSKIAIRAITGLIRQFNNHFNEQR